MASIPVPSQLPLFPLDKRCSKCGIVKPLSDYPRHHDRADGHGSACKLCHNAGEKARQAADPEAYNARRRARRAAKPPTHVINDSAVKRCGKCGTTKPLDQFNRSRDNLDGRHSYCKDCQAAYGRSRRAQYTQALVSQPDLIGTKSKQCPHCNQVLPLCEFGLNRGTKDGRTTYCQSCTLLYRRDYRQTNLEHQREYALAWYHANKDRIKQWPSYAPEVHHAHYMAHREDICAKQRARYKDNAEYFRAYAREYARTHMEERRAYRQQWSHTHKEHRRLYYHRMTAEQRARAREWRRTSPKAKEAKKRDYNRRRPAILAYLRKWREEHFEEWYARWSRSPEGKASIARSQHARRDRLRATPNTLTAAEWQAILERQNHQCGLCHRPFTDTLRPTVDHILPVSKGGGLTADNVGALCGSCNSSKCDKHIDYR